MKFFLLFKILKIYLHAQNQTLSNQSIKIIKLSASNILIKIKVYFKKQEIKFKIKETHFF